MEEKDVLLSQLKEIEKEAERILDHAHKQVSFEKEEATQYVSKLRQELLAKKEALRAFYLRQIEEDKAKALEQLQKKLEEEKMLLKNQAVEKLLDLIAYLRERGL